MAASAKGWKRPPRLGVAWATYYTRPGLRGLVYRYRPLHLAYRAPTFFMERLLRQGAGLGFLTLDDNLTASGLDGPWGEPGKVDILYLSSHGERRNGTYQVDLHSSDWVPSKSFMGHRGPKIAVFDTCDLVDLSNAAWEAEWKGAMLGSALRLILGFASAATVSEDTTYRGRGFAEELIRGEPVAAAWLKAVQNTGFPGLDIGFAIALGDSQRDAQDVLDSASLYRWPGNRTSPSIFVASRACP